MRGPPFGASLILLAAASPAWPQAMTPIPEDALAALNGDWYAQHHKIHLRIRDGVVTVVSNDSVTRPPERTAYKPGATYATFTGITAHEGNRVNFAGSYTVHEPGRMAMQQPCTRYDCFAFKATFGRQMSSACTSDRCPSGNGRSSRRACWKPGAKWVPP